MVPAGCRLGEAPEEGPQEWAQVLRPQRRQARVGNVVSEFCKPILQIMDNISLFRHLLL